MIQREPTQLMPRGTQRLFTKFKFIHSFLPNNSGYIVSYHRIRGNGPWDPDTAVSTDSAHRWVEANSNYNEQTTYASKIRVTFHSAAANNQGKFIAIVVPTVETPVWSSAADFAGMQLQPFAKKVIVGQSTGGKDMKTITHFMNTYQVMGVPKDDITPDSAYSSAMNTVPSLQWYWNILIVSMDAVTLDPQYVAYVDVTYYCELYNPIPDYNQ